MDITVYIFLPIIKILVSVYNSLIINLSNLWIVLANISSVNNVFKNKFKTLGLNGNTNVKGGIACNGAESAEVGKNILENGGSAVDAAIAAMFCEGVTCPQSMGIGGGFIATVYDKSSNTVEGIVARETAPTAIADISNLNRRLLNSRAMTIGVPGELLGYWELHQKFGKLPWESLVRPAINLCRNGHIVTDHLSNVIGYRKQYILSSPSLREVFINPATNRGWKRGDVIFEPKLGDTLELIATEGVSSFYRGGCVGQCLLEDLQNFGGIITDEDLYQYQVRWVQNEMIHLGEDYSLYTCPLPGGGPILCLILNVMKDFIPYNNPGLMWHRLIEAFKHGYGLRTQLGDVNFEPQIKNVNDFKKLL